MKRGLVVFNLASNMQPHIIPDMSIHLFGVLFADLEHESAINVARSNQ